MDDFDRLMEAFVLADPADPAAVRGVRDRVETLRQAGGGHAEELAAIARALDGIIASPSDWPEMLWIDIRRKIIELQADRSGIIAVSRTSWPKEADGPLLDGFVAEAREHLEAASSQLLALETNARDAEALNTVFRAFHTIKGAASCLDLGAMQSLSHEAEALLDQARRGSLALDRGTMDVLFEVVDGLNRMAVQVESFRKTGAVPAADAGLEDLLERIRSLASHAAPDTIVRRNTDTAHAPAPAPDTRVMKEHVRVHAERLDRLVDLIGELVIAESMVSQAPQLRALAAGNALEKPVGQLDKITRELQELAMSLHMVPLRPLFQKMARLARDLSRRLGRPIEFVTTGEDIEIDKAIVDRVSDALVHIVRNAIDHGIEASTDDRTRGGKPATGRIELRARHREGSIFIEVEDDGRGLDAEAIRAKALEKGLLRKGDATSEAELFKLIFLPGFSTVRNVTDISGRGVGLDVAKSGIEALRGRIEVRSRRERGTTFVLRLPLTLAIIDGMVLRSGKDRYIVPTQSITRLVQPGDCAPSSCLGEGEMLSLQDGLIPLFRLDRLLGTPDAETARGAGVAVVVEESFGRAALLADEVLGQQQVVMKTLGMDLERVRGISGAVILPDGQVGLILDLAGLLNRRSVAAVAQP